jgi:hypothetical protein
MYNFVEYPSSDMLTCEVKRSISNLQSSVETSKPT